MLVYFADKIRKLSSFVTKKQKQLVESYWMFLIRE